MEETKKREQDENMTTETNPIRPALLPGRSSATLIAVSDYDNQPYNKALDKTIEIESTFDDERTIDNFTGTEDIHDEFPDGGWKAYLVVLGSFIGLIADFGLANSIGSIETEVSTNVLKTTSSSTISWIFALYMCLTYAGNILCGSFFDKYGARKPMLLGTILISGSLFISANCTKVWQFILGFGIIGGIGTSLCMTPLIGVIGHWFLVNRATATGLATMGGSVGGIVFPMMLRTLFPKVGFAWGMRILGFVCLLCLSVSILLVKDRHKKTSEQITLKSYVGGLIDLHSLCDWKFLSVIGGLFMTELSLMTTLTYLSSYAISKGYSTSKSMLLITIYNASGIPARWLCGRLADKLGNFNMMVITSFIVAMLNFILWFPFGNNISVLYAFSATYGFMTASVLTLNPVCCAQICKINDFGKRYSTMYFFVAFGNLFGIPIAGAIIGDNSSANFDHLVLYISSLSIVGAGIWCFGRYIVGGSKLMTKV